MDEHNNLQSVEMPTVIQEIKEVLERARATVARLVNNELLSTYWNVGRIIAEYEQHSPNRADYGKQTLRELSRVLTKEFGRGFLDLTCKICVRFIWLMKNARHRLAN